MFVARCRPRVLQCLRRKEGSLPVFPARYREQPKGCLVVARGGVAQFSERAWPRPRSPPSGLDGVPVFVRTDTIQEDSMKARRFVSRGTVALVPFLLVASLADSAPRVASARRQAEQKAGRQNPDAQGVQQKTDQQKADPATQQPSEQRSEERRVGKECRSRWSPYH